MRRIGSLCLLLLCLSALPATGVELAWIRLIVGEAEPLVWREAGAWPARPADFPFAPSAVLSFASFEPGDRLSGLELEKKASRWERALEDSGYFSRAAVYVVEIEGEAEVRGVIAEVTLGTSPGFGGGSAYASIRLPLAGGQRSTLSAQAGANRVGLGYRSDTLGDARFVLSSGLSYDNDLLSKGGFVGNRISATAGIGPRLGPLADLLVQARCSLPLDEEAGTSILTAIDGVLECSEYSLFGLSDLDLSASAMVSAYPCSSGLRLMAASRLRQGLGPVGISLVSGLGLSWGALDSRELFPLGSGSLELLGPEGSRSPVADTAVARLEASFQGPRLRLASWLSALLGPFVFAEAGLVGSRADTLFVAEGSSLAGAGGGFRLFLGSPVGLAIDLGYGFDRSLKGGLVFEVRSATRFN
jgi:hypothetical protein